MRGIKKSVLNIYNFLDAPSFLSDYYQTRKLTEPNFSYRHIEQYTKVSSVWPVFHDVSKGKRSIPPSHFQAFVDFMGLTNKEEEYFYNLSHFQKEKDKKLQQNLMLELLKLRKGKTTDILGKAEFSLFTAWYYPTVRAIAANKHFGSGAGFIGKKLIPRVAKKDIEKALRTSLGLGLLIKRGDKYLRSSPTVATPTQNKSHTIRNFHKQAIDLGRKSVEGFDKSKRFLNTLPIFIPKKLYPTIVEKIWNFTEELKGFVGTTLKDDTAYILATQLFPVSETLRIPKKKRKSKKRISVRKKPSKK